MVYNFSLPPLLLYSLLKEETGLLGDWAASLPDLSPEQAFFNFTASHDGIGVRPLQGLVPDTEIDWLARQVEDRGGRVSMKANSDGSQSPYELNITYLDALRLEGDEPLSLARFLTSQAVVLGFKGIPALYIHSLLGTANDLEGLEQTGQNRSINRRKLDFEDIETRLDSNDSPHARVFRKLTQWIQTRSRHPAFHPGSRMDMLHLGPGVFAFLRTSRTGVEKVLCLHNFTSETREVAWVDCFPGVATRDSVPDLLTRRAVRPKRNRFALKPFHSSWLMVLGSGTGRPPRKTAGRAKKPDARSRE